MDALLNLVPGGSLTAILAAVLAALAGVWRVYASGKSAGRNEQKAKEADNRADNLKRIHDASGARPAGGVSTDPHNRDNRR